MNETTSPERRTESGPPALAFGAVLVVIGIILLLAQFADFGFADLGWPIWIIGIGAALLVVGFVLANAQGLVVGGTVVTSIGLLLFYQDATGNWATWAYAWALIGPAASGLGLLLWGLRTANGHDIRNGTWGLLGGLALFAVFFLFFEGVIGLSGDRLPLADWVLPAVIIGIGLVILVRGLFQRRASDA